MLDVSVVIDSEIHVGGDTTASISTHGGGAAANVATWLASLGNDVFLCSRAGDDLNGEFLHEDLDLYGVRHSSERATGEKSGVVVILVNEAGDRTMFPDSGANSGLSIADLPSLEHFSGAYLSGYALINPKSRKNVMEMIQRLKDHDIPIVLDPGTVGALRSIIYRWRFEHRRCVSKPSCPHSARRCKTGRQRSDCNFRTCHDCRGSCRYRRSD